MDIVDIYGHIPDKSELIVGVGNYNNIHGLLTYFPMEDLLQMKPLPEIITPSVVQVILTYERPSNIANLNKVYFSLTVKDDVSKYINIKIDRDGNDKVASATISSEKAFFWIDYSNIDRIPRSQLLAGSLYSLRTTFGEQDYIVSWKVQGFSNGDLVIFLPTKWYEKTSTDSFCQHKEGIITLVESLNQIGFKGYTTQQWCEEVSHVTHCPTETHCGECLGYCHDSNHICYPNPEYNIDTNHPNIPMFKCGDRFHEPRLDQSSMVSFSDSTPTQNTGTVATWIAVAIIFVLVILLVWGISRKDNT
jgi:hypothetical protein